jgi:SAM-dependent methyltransferase
VIVPPWLEQPREASSAPPGEHLIGYHAAGLDPIGRMLAEVQLSERDVFIDLGSGVGRVCIVVALSTTARVRGIELQTSLVERARADATRAGAIVAFENADARDANLSDGTVFFLYCPFTGPALARVLERLSEIDHPIVVCALGIDLDHAPFLRRRPLDDFWLAIYDSVTPPVAAR